MNLLEAPWIPVRDGNGSGPFRLLTYEELLCGGGAWHVSLPRDDLELACIQLLVCMTQVMFLPHDLGALRQRHRERLTPEAFADGVAPCRDWFDLDHPGQPFMQTRGVKAADVTPIQKLLIGLPEGNNHAFFNEVGEVGQVGGTVAAIALFNQASNSPSFGGGFKGSLRGGAPVTTLVAGHHLRETVWRNVLTPELIQTFLPHWQPGDATDVPTWVRPIRAGETIQAQDIGLARGLFWQPARVELVAGGDGSCGLLDQDVARYSGFRKEKFNFTVAGLWPHPHGAQMFTDKKEWKFVSFTTTAPAWTWLTNFVVLRAVTGPDAKEGSIPAPAIAQASQVSPQEGGRLQLLVGGYRTNQASVVERRHELFSLAAGWDKDEVGNLRKLVDVARECRSILYRKLMGAAHGNKDRGVKGLGVPLQDTAGKLFYARTESLVHDALDRLDTWEEFLSARETFVGALAGICTGIFDDLTEPYGHKPELIPAIALARRRLTIELAKLREEGKQ